MILDVPSLIFQIIQTISSFQSDTSKQMSSSTTSLSKCEAASYSGKSAARYFPKTMKRGRELLHKAELRNRVIYRGKSFVRKS